MSIRFSCRCGRKLKVSDEKIGMKVLCPSCGETLKVPKKSQDAYWQDVEPTAEREGYDYVETVKQILVQFVPGVLIVIGLFYGFYTLASQVLMSDSDRPELGYVSGTITFDGKPLKRAVVEFHPLAANEPGNKIASSSARTDDEGQYTLMYVKDEEGAAVGKHQVTIHASVRLPARYNRNTELEREVKPGSQTIDFELTSSSDE